MEIASFKNYGKLNTDDFALSLREKKSGGA